MRHLHIFCKWKTHPDSCTVVELGAGCALPSLLSTMLANGPSLAVITDYPDPTIIGNLTANIERNRAHVSAHCDLRCVPYEWGADARPLL